jgi:hypothetical protein
VPTLQRDAEVLLREKKISAIPECKKALRPDLRAKASSWRRSHRPRSAPCLLPKPLQKGSYQPVTWNFKLVAQPQLGRPTCQRSGMTPD